MKVILISMPDVVPIIIHETAIHMPNLGIASVGGHIDEEHNVYLIDLIRKRRSARKYLTRTMRKIRPDLVGLSAMAWQYDTCIRLAKLTKHLLPGVKIVIGGYHATLMSKEIAESPEAEWIDFMIRGEGEEACRRLVNALAGKDQFSSIPSLSYKEGQDFVHNPRGKTLDLSRLKLPIRDKRRLTWGYHIMYNKIELMETSRGCTRSCNFCSMKHMYGRTFRTFPIRRVLADLDDIYYKRKTRWVFLVDDNMVLDPRRVIRLCDAIIERKYRNLNLVVQADCISMAQNEEMVRKMALAGFKSVFLGIESASKANLETAGKANVSGAARKAVENCHRYGVMVIGGMIFGFPEDDEEAVIRNYEYLNSIGADASYCQILTPYPKTEMRRALIDQGLVTNTDNYKLYSGLWANVKTRYLESDRLQYLFWYHRQKVLGWWDPSGIVQSQGQGWISIWMYAFKPALKVILGHVLKKHGWEGRYEREVRRWTRLNAFEDLD
ncbi:MAG: B12-binding domain-containing radical SAM protein [Desulfobacterales bacterium C00003060]|nr:MAG: B12-binding domain-containing radical SAM protein [Desulfobacterales bacterium C00003060]